MKLRRWIFFASFLLAALLVCGGALAYDYFADPAPVPAGGTRLEPILMYHHVVPNGEDCNDMTVTVSRLEEDFQWLTEHNYHTVLPRELAAGEPLPENPVMITFDDGYRGNYALAYPLFQKYGVKAAISSVIFMPDNWAESFLSWEMCQEMTASGLVEIGSHSYFLHNLDGEDGKFLAEGVNGVQRRPGESDEAFQTRVLDDIQKSYDRISEEVGTPPTLFAYPFGRTDPDADPLIQELFPVTVITSLKPVAADLSDGLYNLPRITVSMDESLQRLLKRAG